MGKLCPYWLAHLALLDHRFMPQGQFQAFLDPKDRPGGAVGGAATMGGVSANEFMMAAAVSEYRSKQQLAQNLATLAIKQDPGGIAEGDAQQQLHHHHHHPQSVGPFQNVCFNEPHGWDWNGYPHHPNHNFHPLPHPHQQSEQGGHHDHPGHLAPLPANSGGSSTNNNNSSGNSSPQNNGGTDSPPVAAAASVSPASNLQHPPIVPDLPQQPLQPEALLAGPPTHAHHHLYYDQQYQQYQYLMQQDFQQYHHHQQFPIHHHQPPPPLEQYGFQDQPSHLAHQQQQPELGTAALSFPTPPTEAGDLNHPPTSAAPSSSSAAGATLVKQEANVSPTGSCNGAKSKSWNNNSDTTTS